MVGHIVKDVIMANHKCLISQRERKFITYALTIRMVVPLRIAERNGRNTKMKRNRVVEVQDYLAARGIIMSETAIVDAALDIVCSQDLLYRFCLSAHLRRKKKENERRRKRSIN